MASTSAGEIVVEHPQGMHLRPATEFARMALATGCEVRVRANDQEANGASVLELAMMGVAQGTRLVITAEGQDAERAVLSLLELVRNGFKR